MKFCELTEIKEALDQRGIKYMERHYEGGAIVVWVSKLMQIANPTEKQRKKFWPEVRITEHEGDAGYRVRCCGIIYEDQGIENVMDLIDDYVLN